ncbi:MAG: glycoside hydrolase family 32 protein [Anaerolineae bacterium]|uniref:glycoside hydrolase family 32 protein n=1 Tax=Promineifilum sp. TaxID=2664178 RepID=UPI0024120A51|nr:glycoside hydrolase family 32 protein [Promineifilum sp.]MCO5182167.1 glycoside hydrolase family 32 protein [Promineifilum sp.]MCW5848092.1 glycoside hydrolase family 32 protein [Anaerolineae bacterium]
MNENSAVIVTFGAATSVATRQAMAGDPHRPLYHFLAPANWMNDPNGFIHWRGQYHLFYQYNPEGAFHGNIHWGHAVSADLVHWQDQPVALAPTPDSPDSGGCWSGSAIIAGGKPLIFYSGVYPQVVCVATGSDDLNTWTKHPDNPIIAGPPPGIDAGDPPDFRDPYVWREGAWWYMVMGSRDDGVGGVVLLYRSADLMNWEYVRQLLAGDQTALEPFWTGSVWECPNLIAVDGRHALIVSYQAHISGELLFPGYYVGDFSNDQFTPEVSGILEYGGYLYAPQAIVDERRRPILIGWLLEGLSKAAQRAAGWSGVMSLPRLLSLGEDGTLRMQPVPELRQLRGEHLRVEQRIVRPGAENILDEVRGDCLEIEVVLEHDQAMSFGLRLRCSPDGSEQTTIRCDVTTNTVTVDRQRSSLGTDMQWGGSSKAAIVEQAPLAMDGPVRMHIFLDRSVLEVFFDDRIVLSTRIYPTRPDSLGVELFTVGGALRVRSLDVWKLAPIWPILDISRIRA